MGWFPVLLVALPAAAFTAVFLAPGLGDGIAVEASVPEAGLAASPSDRERAFFPICSGSSRVTCVVDGDTIWYEREKIRIADIDTPEVFSPACPSERAAGERATRRLQELLNAGSFSLETAPGAASRDRYGRALRIVTRGGESLGQLLVREGLAERWGGARRDWC
jgi:endonuclease YncB( thermonuclease family)